MPPKPRRYPEHDAQCALIAWARFARIPIAVDVKVGAVVSDYLFAIPNGGKRGIREAARMKAEGVKAGVFDLFLPLARHDFHGLWIEMKAPGKKQTIEQATWGIRMDMAGYSTWWTDDWLDAKRRIAWYLGIVSC